MAGRLDWWQGLSAAIGREARIVLSHPWEAFACLLMPLVWCVIIAGLLNDGLMRGMPLAVADQDCTPESREVIRAVAALPSVKLVPMERPEAAESLKAGEVAGILAIPHGWSETRRRPGGASLELSLSRTTYAMSTVLELDIKKALLDWTVAKTARSASMLGGTDGALRIIGVFQPYEALFGNEAFNFKYYLASALIPMLLGLGCVLSTCSSLVREWRQGRVGELLGTGIAPSAAITGKLLFWTSAYSLYMAAYVAWFTGFLGASPAGSLWLWLAAGVIYAAGMAGTALLFAAVSPFWCFALVLCILTAAPTIPFTGFTFPSFDMDGLAQAFAQLLPLTWFVHAQEQQWVLASPDAVSLKTLGIASLFVIVPVAAGLPLLCWRLRRWAAQEAASKKPAPSAPDREERPGFLEILRKTVLGGVFNRNTFAIFTGGVAFYLILYGWPYSAEQITKVPVVITDLDGSDASRTLIRDLSSAVKIDPVALLQDESEARRMIQEDRVNAAILIPADFGRDLASGKGVRVGVYGNGAFPSQAHSVYAALAAIVQSRATEAAGVLMLAHGVPASVLARQMIAPPMLVTGDMFNRIGGYRVYMVPMVGVLIVQSVMLMGITMVAGEWISARRREAFVREAMRSAKGFAAMLAAFALMALFWVLYAEGVYFGFMELGSFANPAGTLLIGVLFAAAVAAFSLMVTFALGSNHQSTPLVILTSAPCVFLAGCIYPAGSFAPWAAAVSKLFPSTAGINGMLAASQNGAATGAVLPWALHLALLTVIYGAAALALARWRGARLDRGEPPPSD